MKYETYKTVIQRGGQLVKVEPDIERACGWNVHFQSELLESLQHVVALRLEVPLQRNLERESPTGPV